VERQFDRHDARNRQSALSRWTSRCHRFLTRRSYRVFQG